MPERSCSEQDKLKACHRHEELAGTEPRRFEVVLGRAVVSLAREA